MRDSDKLADLIETAQIEVSYWDRDGSRAVARPLLDSEKALIIDALLNFDPPSTHSNGE
jgi:hypothetical protein